MFYLIFFVLIVVVLQSGKSFVLTIALFLLLILIGLRNNVGGDWVVYERWVSEVGLLPISEVLVFTDPLYGLINWISYRIGGGVYLVNTICAALYLYGLHQFCKIQHNPFLAFTIALPYLTMVVATGYTRQSVAMGFILLAIPLLLNKHLYKYILFICLATLFHKSAIVMLVLLSIHMTKRNFIKFFIIGCLIASIVFVVLYNLLLSKLNAYVQTNMYSGGSIVRLIISNLSFFVFLFLIKYFKTLQASLYKLILLLGVINIALLLLSFSLSTLADRIGVYTSIIQMLVLANVSLFITKRSIFLFNVTITFFYFIMYCFWLYSSPHAINSWIPYDNILFYYF